MIKHQRASDAQNKKLHEATKHLHEAISSKKGELKKLLSDDLAAEYSLCYWADDGCLYCSDDGRNWYVVRCIT
jgi:hypothetical protein